jgi:hypothetical protein
MALTLIATFAVVVLRPKPHKGHMDAPAFELAKNRAELAHWLMVTQLGLATAASIVGAIGLLITDRAVQR